MDDKSLVQFEVNDLEWLKGYESPGYVMMAEALLVKNILQYSDSKASELVGLIQFFNDTSHITAGGLNILELAILNEKKGAVWIIVANTNTNITNHSEDLINLKNNDTLNALLASVIFEDKELLDKLEGRVESNVPKLEDARSKLGEDALSLTLKYTKDHDFFRHILRRMSGRLVFNPAPDSRYFMLALKSNDKTRPVNLDYLSQIGMDTLTKYEKIAELQCVKLDTCLHNLVCNNSAPHYNSFHLVSGLEGDQDGVLDFLFQYSDSCWQIPDENGNDAYQIAIKNNNKQIERYYEDNILSLSYRLKRIINGLIQSVESNSDYIIIFAPILIFVIYFFNQYISRLSKRHSHKFSEILKEKTSTFQYNNYKYKGPLDKEILKVMGKGHVTIVRDIVASIKTSYNKHDLVDEEEFPYEFISSPNINSQHLPNRLFTPRQLDKNIQIGITFYIPGTASSTRNSGIEEVNASHLAYVLNTKVLLINHRLAPEDPWPTQLDDVCNCIIEFCRLKKKKVVNLAGYSMGGYIATLASPILLEYNIIIERLILFAPALDLGAEFRNIKIKCNTLSECAKFLPITLQSKTSVINEFQKNAELDNTFDSEKYSIIIAQCFKKMAFPPEKLRELSPTWFSDDCLRKFYSDIKITVILGENDYFRVDAEVFFEKLSLTGCPVEKIVIPGGDHTLIWQKIYPIYMAQSIICSDGESGENVNFSQVVKLDAQLLMKNKGSNVKNNSTANSERLKKSCENLHKLSLLGNTKIEHTKQNPVPQYTRTNFSKK